MIFAAIARQGTPELRLNQFADRANVCRNETEDFTILISRFKHDAGREIARASGYVALRLEFHMDDVEAGVVSGMSFNGFDAGAGTKEGQYCAAR